MVYSAVFCSQKGSELVRQEKTVQSQYYSYIIGIDQGYTDLHPLFVLPSGGGHFFYGGRGGVYI